jgi:hypothetical protein
MLPMANLDIVKYILVHGVILGYLLDYYIYPDTLTGNFSELNKKIFVALYFHPLFFFFGVF